MIALALGDGVLVEICDSLLRAAGHLPLRLRRPLELLDLPAGLVCDAVCIDDTQLGLDTLLVVRGGLAGELPVVGLGVDAPGVTLTLSVPLRLDALTDAIVALTSPGAGSTPPSRRTEPTPPGLRFDSVRRMVSAGSQSVSLTRTEFRLLEYLQSQPDRDVTLEELLTGVWGTSEGIGTTALIRSHIRNLRVKLSQIGAGDVIRVSRGRGYTYVG